MKRIFIIVAIAVAVAVIATGVTLYLNNIQIQTPSPQVALPAPVTPVPISPPPPPVTPEPEEPQTPPVVETPAPVEALPSTDPASKPVEELPKPEPELKPEPVVIFPPIPDDFIVDKEFWQNAFILQRPDDLKGPRGVGFSDIPIETEIRAPISGYVFLYTAMWENLETVEIVISEYEDGLEVTENRRFFFLANHFYPINISGRIEKGEALARVRVQSEVLPGFFDRKTIFAMGFKGDWNTDLTIEDPREFLWAPMQEIVGEDK